jgi:hypothetical protein
MCKVKIGSAYEPKWFERRATQGTYSGKNVPLDSDAMWLQSCLIGKRATSFWKTRMLIAAMCIAGILFYVKMLGFI